MMKPTQSHLQFTKPFGVELLTAHKRTRPLLSLVRFEACAFAEVWAPEAKCWRAWTSDLGGELFCFHPG